MFTNTQRQLARVFVMVLGFCLWSQSALAWWNDAWSYRLPITVDASVSGANLIETNQEVTVLLKLHSGNFSDFFLVNENLSDIRFIGSDDKTPLKFHVEHYDFINQLIYIWVKLPKVTGGINTERVWMYYGNAEATATSDTAGSYDNNTGLNYHFNVGQPVPQDMTAYGNHASENTATVIENALIGNGLEFAAGNSLVIADTPSLAFDPEKGLTTSFWFKPGPDNAQSTLLQRNDGNVVLALRLDGNQIYAQVVNQSGELVETSRAAAITPDQWHHVALVLSAERLSVLVNAQEVAYADVAAAAHAGSWLIGNAQSGERPFVGQFDELRIDTVARNNDWIRTQLATQGISNTLLHTQQAEQLGGSGGGSGLFQVLIGSIEESGWTIIMLLAVMALISWAVMFAKFLYIRRVISDNDKFIAAYKKLDPTNLASLDEEESEEDKELADTPITQAIFGKHDHFQSSPLYHLYHSGIKEVRDRMGVSVSAKAAGLSASAVETIRAVLDAQTVREMQRLNSKMVLLTIAISGGPFLGLLGTVVGVMITFGAIALTGDVNISAIAPGVAAALMTTVAGLIVAIPALFGYNYLMTRIKECTADMRIFCDELLTKFAEHYGNE